MAWRKKSEDRTAGVAEDIAEAQQVRQEIVAQRNMLQRGLTFLAERQKMNGFSEDLEITYATRANGGANREPRHA